MKRKVAVIIAVAALAVTPALAILGVGDIVFDPTNYAEAVDQLLRLEQQYDQLVQTYQMITNQYNQMLWMARQDPVNMVLRYRALATPWTPSFATNTYGTTATWVTGINSGQGVMAGYSGATQALGAYGGALGSIPADQLDRVKTNYATVELTDGANLSAMQTLGNLRANAPAVETAIQNLEADSLSSDPEMNTEIAVLNKINAANVIGMRNGQDTNKLLAALAEEQIIQAKRQRDAEAEAFNIHIGFMSQGQSFMAAQAANASGAMMTWRMP
jgi:hypothetical protein